MKSAAFSIMLVASIGAFSHHSLADCSFMAIAGAPKMPELIPEPAEMRALQVEMQEFVTRAESRLEVCEKRAEPVLYNMAVSRLRDKVDRFNAIARRYNSVVLAKN